MTEARDAELAEADPEGPLSPAHSVQPWFESTSPANNVFSMQKHSTETNATTMKAYLALFS